MEIKTWPNEKYLKKMAEATPAYMRPNTVPLVVIVYDVLNSSDCEEIIKAFEPFSAYTHSGCDALTKEATDLSTLKFVDFFARTLNKTYFGYELDEGNVSWLQTYAPGSSYQTHMDGAPGSMRKMTALLMLSQSEAYAGGKLVFYYHPESITLRLPQGSLVIFHPWLLHEVLPVTSGTRQTINMGFWGPNFK